MSLPTGEVAIAVGSSIKDRGGIGNEDGKRPMAAAAAAEDGKNMGKFLRMDTDEGGECVINVDDDGGPKRLFETLAWIVFKSVSYCIT